MHTLSMKTSAFSLIELVVAVVILGVLAALAIPRFSHGAVNESEADLRTHLAVLRTAIEMYYHDHGAYPAQKAADTAGAEVATAAAFIHQLTQYTDVDGRVGPAPSATFRYGPYLRNGVPQCSVSAVGPSADVHVITGAAEPAYNVTVPHAGWIYNCETGYIAANSPGQDQLGVRYDSY
jgi:prepilin-type N-terminal cleavage/methylation domain-containing protein